MHDIREIAGEIKGIHSETIDIGGSFMDFAACFAATPGTLVLMSGGDLDCARYHILGARPWLSLSGQGHEMTIKTGKQTIRFEADPFDTLRMILKAFPLGDQGPAAPFRSGLMGYLSYDLKDFLEDMPRTSIDDLGLPHICLFAPSIIVIRDRTDGSTRLCIPNRIHNGGSSLNEDLETLRSILESGSPVQGSFTGDALGFRSNFTRSGYKADIEKIREYIASGHVYQVNMSQRFEMDFSGDPFTLFRTLYHDNPAPFFAYINADDHHIVSTSPERFLMQRERCVETRPIKGTRPRGESESEDRALKLELERSKKDDAELSMIVDLMRNDLGKVCEGGSVRVAQHKKVEAYRNVYHLVSIVKGILADGCDSVELVKATFPGGSITGCPKIRAMEIIDELETNRRHVYTGSIGYISFHDTMDLSIAIRTATIYNGKMIFSVGGGIVYDSDPSDEYDETLHKGKTLMGVFRGNAEKENIKVMAWVSGNIQPLDQASIRITDLGFQYGYGFFETIRVDRGSPNHLDAHMARFNSAWKKLFDQETPDLSWDKIIKQVINENGLEREISAVKVIASFGSREKPPFDHRIIVTARPYVHRLEGKNEQGLKLITYPHPRQTPLADLKTLNYLYYYLAGRWAKKHGCDEALILNPDGSISETNSANILLTMGNKVIIPASPHVLPGIMEDKVCELLLNWGYFMERREIFPEDLFLADNVFITNSLIGAVPVLSVDGKALKSTTDLCGKINDLLLR
ncbi:aminodeoxychorismate synthase component I [Thermodesulfobacteriota bacterium]